MEAANSVQEATASAAPPATAGGGGESGANVSNTGVAEPTAPAESAEPTAEASAESTQPTEAPTETVTTFPEVDSFDWDSWDGTDYEAFPETVKPWADKLNGYHTKSLDSLTKSHNTEVDYWKRMYEAMSYGDEDPRVQELTSKIEELNALHEELKDKYTAAENSLAREREAENDRYFKWFESNYQGKLEQLAKDHGADTAEKMVLDLMDLDMDVHVAVETALLGNEAVDTAKQLSNSVKDSSLVLEILKSRFSPKEQKPESAESVVKKETNPATQVVAGSAPVSRPAQLTKEKAPAYGAANRNDRMASLMSAAENAIRKSKRR